ncbi:MAG: hypothetical protein Q8898_04545 [Bacillota bacterium]|nr:hypothetical protein [Bacillota bacterium]
MLKKALSIFFVAVALFGFVTVSEAKTTKPVTEKATAYITAIKFNKGKMTGSFDYIQWYFGKDADREFVKDCKCGKEMPYAPDGYYIRNINKKIRTFTISNSAQYVLQTRTDTIKWNEKVTKTQFLNFLKKRNQQKGIPFHIEVKGGVVTKITEQYIP